jgi:hypothetical protein
MWFFDPIHKFIDPYVANLDEFFDWIEAIEFVQNYAADSNAYATIESIHILSVGLMVGSIVFVDLRLLGFIGRGNSVRRASKILPYTWWTFLLATISGVALAAVAATRYAHNEAFQIKMLLILLAGVNMAIFHYGVWRSVDVWDRDRWTPLSAKVAGALSLLFWLGALFYGRFTPWVG